MKKTFILLAMALTSCLAYGQVTVTGHTVLGTGATASSGVSIQFELIGDSTQQCRVAGTGLVVFTNPPLSFTQAQLAAGISLYPNSSITCGTVTGGSRWRYTIKSGGIGTRQCSLNITANTNLDSTACLNATAPPVTVSPTSSLYCLIDASNCGFTGTTTAPVFNAATGFQVSSGATSGNVLRGNGTNFVSSLLAAADLSNGVTGSGAAVLATSPSLTTPNIGAATATSLTTGQIIQPAATIATWNDNTGGTRVSIPANGTSQGTLNNFNLTGGSSIAGTAVSGATGSGNMVFATSPTITTPTIARETINTGISQGSGFKHQRFGATCTTAATADTGCSSTYTWTSAFADSNYTAVCQGEGNVGNVAALFISSRSASQIVISVVTYTNSAVSFGAVDCIAVHD